VWCLNYDRRLDDTHWETDIKTDSLVASSRTTTLIV
jgi:hypothetical protein